MLLIMSDKYNYYIYQVKIIRPFNERGYGMGLYSVKYLIFIIYSEYLAGAGPCESIASIINACNRSRLL